ncbi:1-aminocyclopropane-1-carboxylate oxidase homolog 1-like [Cynara cardunculus var. scolymus]|uniref:Non-heme dioxygenase N-terminal domain-containing protein n=1 Tax=Cynara cardunculus var. scolymus TaxID=59895 RepID=A0A118JTI1_CYNCS|nr:1-aminocyclopropane-1-carboxylate oxidase homolog 1-like [Cynara cardunculus var. scolymus]KVH89637.1 Non-heme dioxygenase N-terminal domain-containing protein [Cynara cardunculus var. scolymus]
MEISQDSRIKQLKVFDDTKLGVKGLVDAAAGGSVVIPEIFIRPPDELAEDLELARTSLQVPVIDLMGVDDKGSSPRERIVQEVKQASEEWGFFHVVNHGIPIKVLKEMLTGVSEFNEQDLQVKKQYYSRDPEKLVRFNSNYDLYMSRSANWRDSLFIDMLNSYHVDPQDLPSVCRDPTVDYLNHLEKLVHTLFELLSEALGLETNHLNQMECGKGRSLACHYYPACPMPDQTLGVSKHTDASFITVLLQDEIGGLQVLHENQWADVEPISGSLIVNIGDLLQILSNDKFKSVIHRAIGNVSRTRTSVACFLDGVATPPKVYGPIMELITKESPQMYTEFTVRDYIIKFFSRGLDEKSGLNHVRI